MHPERSLPWLLLPAALSALVTVRTAVSSPPRDVACIAAEQVQWTPDTPRAGTLFTLRLRNTSSRQVGAIAAARIAGEPVHFRADGDSAIALAAAPIDSARGLRLVITCADGSSSSARIPTSRAEYPLEELRVAPRFSAPPDSALLARQRRESARAGAVSRRSHETPRLWQEPFMKPRTSRITSDFGGGRVFNGSVTSRHMGTDYAGAVGAPVRAANRGVVRLVDGFYLGGNVVYIDHGEGIVSAYLHLSKQLVAEGDTVARGAVIGEVGATGRVTGPHLHFIARYGNITVDAASLWTVPSAP
jgi:murein DD-endopeptidase MepM/ murein hydrolase activator NlpD